MCKKVVIGDVPIVPGEIGIDKGVEIWDMCVETVCDYYRCRENA